jgi:endonuclease/exonuclease/phosphatase family metal-dependent hydrolase
MVIRLITANIWDLPVPLPFMRPRTRIRRLFAGLTRLDPDILILQEAFRPRTRRRLLRLLHHLHPDARARSRRWFGFVPMDGAGGLMTLSRWPIRTTRYQRARRIRRGKPDERIGRKGCLWTTIATPAGDLLLGNVHLYAGNTPVDAHIRAIQARHLLWRGESRAGMPCVLAGDWNWDLEFERSERGPTGIVEMGHAGFREVADNSGDGIATMDPRHNAFARYVPWHRPPRRLSYVYFRGPGLDRGPEPPALCLHEEPISDHYGLQVTLRFDP